MNYDKLKTSALIALGGIVISVLPVVSSNLIDVINKGASFNWQTPLTLIIGAVSTWIVATARNYVKHK